MKFLFTLLHFAKKFSQVRFLRKVASKSTLAYFTVFFFWIHVIQQVLDLKVQCLPFCVKVIK